MTSTAPLTIDVVSDVVCPWCFIGMKRLQKAVAAAGVEVQVNWRPYQLDPTVPAEGLDRKAYMLGKFGSEDKIREIHGRIEPLGRTEGIAFDFDAITVAPNTLDAHRLIRWAGASGAAVQGRLVALLFSLYFEKGANIGDRAVLVEASREAGMDASVVEALLPTDTGLEEVRKEIATAAQMGVTGVPCFLLERRYAIVGAQEADTLADAIRQVFAAKARGELNDAG